MTEKKRLSTWAGLAVLAAAMLCLADARPPAAADVTTYDHGLHWRVTAPGKPDNYVLGTYHSADPRILAVIEAVSPALLSCDLAAFELEINRYSQATAALMGIERSRAAAPQRTTLEEKIGTERFAALRRALPANAVPTEILQQLSPWTVFLILSGGQRERDVGGELVPFLDMRLQTLAHDSGLRVLALERVAEQVVLFDSTDPEMERNLLVETIDVGERSGGLGPYIAAQLELSLELYLDGDVSGIMEAGFPPMGRAEKRFVHDLMARLIYRRNARMVERVVSMLDKGGTFVAIGAAHLPGRRGMLNFLADRGYGVTPVAIHIPAVAEDEESTAQKAKERE